MSATTSFPLRPGSRLKLVAVAVLDAGRVLLDDGEQRGIAAVDARRGATAPDHVAFSISITAGRPTGATTTTASTASATTTTAAGATAAATATATASTTTAATARDRRQRADRDVEARHGRSAQVRRARSTGQPARDLTQLALGARRTDRAHTPRADAGWSAATGPAAPRGRETGQ